MYPPSVWEYAKNQGWLEKRPVSELNKFVTVDNENQTILDKVMSLGFNSDELNYVLYKVPDKHKDKISKYVVKLNNDALYIDRFGQLNDILNDEIIPFFKK